MNLRHLATKLSARRAAPDPQPGERGSSEAEAAQARLEQALATLERLLDEYESLTDGACFHYAKAEAARFRAEAAETASLPQRRALAEHVWRHAVALERAIDQWRGDVFYALGGTGQPDPFLR